MFFKTVDDLVGTEREAVGDGWKSRRFLIAEDGLPFSVHETTVAAGTELRFNYENHSETVYCIEGKASVEDVAQNRIFPIGPGTFYSVGIGDDHILRIEQDTKFLCIFEPSLKGREEAD
jgi:L-ectoine synthase